MDSVHRTSSWWPAHGHRGELRYARIGLRARCLLSAHHPLSNQRNDEYGGTLENRLRYPVEVFRAMRACGQRNADVSSDLGDRLVPRGVDGTGCCADSQSIHGSGCRYHPRLDRPERLSRRAPSTGRMFQTPFSDQVRNEARIPTIAVGNITEAEQVNAVIAAGRADLCALARPHLVDPFWTLHAAAELGYTAQHWPRQYRRAGASSNALWRERPPRDERGR